MSDPEEKHHDNSRRRSVQDYEKALQNEFGRIYEERRKSMALPSANEQDENDAHGSASNLSARPYNRSTSHEHGKKQGTAKPHQALPNIEEGSVSKVDRSAKNPMRVLDVLKTAENRRESVINIKGHKNGLDDKIATTLYNDEHFDHMTPHNLFVEMDELIGDEFIEQSRWIKYEECREEGSEKWGKPHVSSLSFHSLLNVRIHLERGLVLLDVDARDMPNLLYKVTQELHFAGLLEDELSSEFLRVLLSHHKYVDGGFRSYGDIRRNFSRASIGSGLSDHARKPSIFDFSRRTSIYEHYSGHDNPAFDNDFGNTSTGTLKPPTYDRQASIAHEIDRMGGKLPTIMMRMPEDSEGCLTLCGAREYLSEPIVAFVRLSEATVMTNAMEVPLPLRFLILVFTPDPWPIMDHYQVGRSFSTLMSNKDFQEVVYSADDRNEILGAINEFLDDSIVLPPGDWARKNLLSMSEIYKMRQRKQERKAAAIEAMEGEDAKEIVEKSSEKDDHHDESGPFVKSPYFFGGVYNDIRKRYKHYLSDITDGLNAQCVAASIFIYFAALSGAIAFGGLYAEKTGELIGIPETLITSCLAGVLFVVFSGMPLIIVGVTGPILLFDEALMKFAGQDIEFLAWRCWIGIWMLIISLLVAFFQGSILIKYFTKFTKEIFKALIAIIYIYEASVKLAKVFKKQRILPKEGYCNDTVYEVLEDFQEFEENKGNGTFLPFYLDHSSNETMHHDDHPHDEPNTAMLTLILCLGTLYIAWELKNIRNGTFFGRTVRRALGDFGVPIAIVIMSGVAMAYPDIYTEKLNVPDGLDVTNPKLRGWPINPLGDKIPMPIWVPFASVIPGALLYLLIFVETSVCELLMMEKATAKGAGLHLDIIILSIGNCIGAFFGGPWICAATVRAVAHISALTVMSTTHAPGESPKVLEVKDQRLSGMVVYALIGFSVLLSPILKLVPFSVLFGVFFYMGFSSIPGMQLFDRIFLMFKPVKYHPSNISYVKLVKTWKMHLFTVLQVLGFIVLWVVKSSPISLAFPFFVVAMVPYRMLLKYIFTPAELEALDGHHAGSIIKDESHEPDFYDEGIGG